MPDLKLSGIAAVAALAAGDRLYAVAGGQSAAITVANLFAGVTSPTAGGGQPHNNMQPWLALNWIVKV